ncbi:MAG: DUF2807 domain-containing protein [Parvularculaceae bacterium]
MSSITKTLITSISALSLMATAASAKDYAQIDKIELDDFIATVKIKTVKGDKTSVTITSGSKTQPIDITKKGTVLMIEGPGKPDPIKRRSWNFITTNGKVLRDDFRTYLADYPTITIKVPAGMDVEFTDAITILTAEDLGDLKMQGLVHVRANIGDIDSGDVSLDGSGDIEVGHVAADLTARLRGSGDLVFASAATAELRLQGSGDIEIGDVAGAVTAELSGSGDIEVENIAGDAILSLRGSGDIETGEITGDTEMAISGSGDIVVDKIDQGASDVRVSGSGDILIKSGRAEAMRARVSGSGTIDFRGVAKDPDVSTSSSAGDIYIKDYEGTPKISGRGDIKVGNLRGKDYR